MSMIAVLRSISPEALERSLAHPDSFRLLLSCEEAISRPEQFCTLEKTWQAIHFLLTGDTSDVDIFLSAAIYGSRESGLELPAGPVMYLSAEEVRGVATELNSINRDEISTSFSVKNTWLRACANAMPTVGRLGFTARATSDRCRDGTITDVTGGVPFTVTSIVFTARR